jgi:hypothetical protein
MPWRRRARAARSFAKGVPRPDAVSGNYPAVLPEDAPRAAEGVERGVGGRRGGAVVAVGVVELDVGRRIGDDDGGVQAEELYP